MSNSTENNANSDSFEDNTCFIYIVHRDKNYKVKFIDFSSKSSYKDVIIHPHSFQIMINNVLEPTSVDALVKHINTRKVEEVIDENNIFDLNFLAHLYDFYLLQAATGPFLLSKIPVNLVFEAFENRKNIDGYVQSFSYYLTHNFDTFVRDPSFYHLPFNIIEKMLDFNASELTANDIVQFTINTYYVYGKKSLTLLEKANNCKSISETNNQNKSKIQNESEKKSQNLNSKSNLRNVFYKMIDSDDINKSKEDKTSNSSNSIPTASNNDNNNDNINDNILLNEDSFDLLTENNNEHQYYKKKNNKNKNNFNLFEMKNNDDNFSVNSDIYKNNVILKQKVKSKRGGKILEKECSTELLIRLYATIAKERPYPYTQYLCTILSKRRKIILDNTVQKDIEELRYNISSVYIALLETTQGNRNAAYILLTSLFESNKIDFLKNSDIINLYKYLADIPPPKKQDQSQQLQLQKTRSQSLRFSFSFEDITQRPVSEFDKRLLEDQFDWGAHGMYMLYRIYQEGLFGSNKDYNKAQLFLKKSLDRGYKEAFFKMSSFIVLSRDFLSIKEDKLEILRKAADFGNGDYQFAYACNLSERTDKLSDLVRAAHYFKLALLSGHPSAKPNYERIQCQNFPPTDQQCKKIFTRLNTEKIDLSTRLFLLKRTAEAGFDQSLIMYPTLLADTDCSPLNMEKPMSQTNQIKEVKSYFRMAIAKNMKYCHSSLAIFLLKHCKKRQNIIEILNILSEGTKYKLNDSMVIYARLLLRMLGNSYRKPYEAISILQESASTNFIPALLELSSTFLYGVDVSNIKPDIKLAMSPLKQLYQLKEPAGSSLFLYIQINDPTAPRQLVSARIQELKYIADNISKSIGQQQQAQSKSENDFAIKNIKNLSMATPLWLYAKVFLEGKATETDFKSAVLALKKADDFIPALVLLVSLSLQFSGIVKTGFQLFNLSFLSFSSLNSSSSSNSNDSNLPRNFDSSLLPLPSTITAIIEKYANLGDPTFRYKFGSILLDEDERSELGFELIRQSASAGSICGMLRYGLIRLSDVFRPRNEYEAIEMFKKAGMKGLEIGSILYARYAMKYSELRAECLQLLQLIHAPEMASQTTNFVTGRKHDEVDGNKLKLSIGAGLCLQGGTSLQEAQYYLNSLIHQYEYEQIRAQPEITATTANGNSDKKSSVSKIDYAEALFYYAKLLEQMAFSPSPNDPSISVALDNFLRSHSNGYMPAIESYVSLLMKVGKVGVAVDILLDNLKSSTFSLYKIGSMTLFDAHKDITMIAESQAIDFIKLATMMDDANQFPDVFWKFGTMLQDGFHVAKDDQNALNYFYQAAEYGCVNAIVAIGSKALNESMKAIERSKTAQNSIVLYSIAAENRNTAFECFSRASRSNSKTGSWCEAMCLLNGVGCARDLYDAIRILRSLASSGDRDAIYKLGKIAFNASKGGRSNLALFDLGIRYITSAAQLGHSTALWRLGLLILQGKCNQKMASNIVNRNDANFFNASPEKVAAELFRKSADLGNLRASSLYSLCLENGIGVARNVELAKFYAK